MTRRDILARWILLRLAPQDADTALEDLRDESARVQRDGRSALTAFLRFWAQVTGVCAYALRDRVAGALGGRLRPGRAARMAFLGLARSPGTAVAATLALGIGLGATVALLGVIHGMFRPLPVPQGDEIVRAEVRSLRGEHVPLSRDLLETWAAPAPGLAAGGAFRVFATTLDDAEGYARRRSAAEMTPEVFRLLQVTPLLGRLPSDHPADRGGALLGYGLWQDLYKGDSGVIGTGLVVNGRPVVVIGVMPPGFAFPYSQEVWTVLDPTEPGSLAGAELVGRRLRDVDPEAVGMALEPGLAGLPDAAAAGAARRARVRPFVGGRGEGGETVALAGLSVLVALLLAVCAANVSTLLLVRATERARVLAVHAALGAPRLQVALQLLMESLWIALAGGALGLLMGWGLLSWIEANLAVHWGYYWMRMEVRPEVLAWTGGVVLLAALVAGTVPAVMAMRTDLRTVLSSGAGRGAGGRRSVAGSLFVGGQVALSTAGLVATVFLSVGVLRSGSFAGQLPLDEVVVATVPLGEVIHEAEARRAAVRGLARELEALGNASVSTGIPTFGAAGTRVTVLGGSLDGEPPVTDWSAVDAAHLDVHGLAVIRGRGLRAGDGGDELVVVVNESFVRRFYGGGDALGARLSLEGVHGPGESARIVGIVADHIPERPGTRSDRVFVPIEGRDASAVTLSMRTRGGAGEAGPALREAVRRVDPALPVEDVRTLRSFMDWLTRMPRVLGLFGALGGLAGVLVAAVGLYGVMAFQVRLRLPELGVRMALGAGSGRILMSVVRAGIRRVLPGVALGLAMGAVVAPLLAAFSFGVSPWTWWVYLCVATGMLGVSIASSLGPAVRAARLEPLAVLRTE